MTLKTKEIHIKCPKCGWGYAVKNTETGKIMCVYCQYRSKDNENGK